LKFIIGFRIFLEILLFIVKAVFIEMPFFAILKKYLNFYKKKIAYFKKWMDWFIE
jgi:hypothetical protein